MILLHVNAVLHLHDIIVFLLFVIQHLIISVDVAIIAICLLRQSKIHNHMIDNPIGLMVASAANTIVPNSNVIILAITSNVVGICITNGVVV